MWRHYIIVLPFVVAALGDTGCGKEVCDLKNGEREPSFEVNVSFAGFDRQAAAVLEFDSSIVADKPAGSDFDDWKVRRVGRIPFPNSARDGSQTFIFDTGAYFRTRAAANTEYTLVMWLRVYDAQGRLLGEGKFKRTSTADQCHLNNAMTVSDDQSCAGKEDGDPCPQRNGADRVCRGEGDNLACENSTCGDGYVDRLNGELCEAGVGDSSYLTCGKNCLPVAVDRVLTQAGVSWLDVLTPTAPVARENAAVAARSAANDAILFGGRTASGELRNDTWRFDGSTWTEITAGGTRPPARHRHSMVYQAARDRVLLFGGTTGSGDTPVDPLGDLWSWDPTSGWVQLTVSGSQPPARHSAPMAYDPSTEEVILFGGYGATGPLNDTWVLTHTGSAWQWQQQNPTASPSARFAHTLTWLPG